VVEGFEDGWIEGKNVGAAEGLGVGALLGVTIGAFVGEIVGLRGLLAVGTEVGELAVTKNVAIIPRSSCFKKWQCVTYSPV
jgi:predicted MFS family arabinose efflux permease